ncbi:50S ribosomal protein L5 [Candidatus Deianiraea vastatrix]|uniref:50S ribosomal protein L5 n=1 Tax=Candidatus Deianiraea vastatrix TaxID=2163644 RepID=A0A5B8XD72_9RICK|nr:50S ribosomal protein L5 [Candidatus Deianiraea vastatrix]QED23200.1 50S ribosomal protein L5 [Candidatus Deianiraea vastatrix]
MEFSTLQKYKDFLREISESSGVKNVHSLPKIEKIVLSFNLGSSGNDKKFVESVFTDMVCVSGSIPVIKNAKFSDANFKIRDGQPVSILATLRGKKLFYFLDMLIYGALPRIRDFRGLRDSFDFGGNFTFTISGQSSVMYESNFSQDLNINIVISNSNPTISKKLLSSISVPFVS